MCCGRQLDCPATTGKRVGTYNLDQRADWARGRRKNQTGSSSICLDTHKIFEKAGWEREVVDGWMVDDDDLCFQLREERMEIGESD